MAKSIFISGGANSGKSRLAEQLAANFGAPLGYLATATAGDEEMAARIARHQARRGAEWQTMEEPVDLAGVLAGHNGYFKAVLVDCITLWLTNLLLAGMETKQILLEVEKVAALLPTLQTTVILVSNEVGLGIVPDNQLARTFRELAGTVNQILAARADEVYLIFSGLPLKLKG